MVLCSPRCNRKPNLLSSDSPYFFASVVMYVGRSIPGQSFDYTRRYQNDIIVYSENELRSVMGNLTRGTRVVIANDIYLTKTINVNIRSESLTKTTGVDRREVVVAGFGGGSLRVKSGVSPFNLFTFGPSQQDGITFSHLFVSGFKSFIYCKPVSGAIYHADLTIENCYMEAVQEIFKLESAGAVFFTRAKITNNRFVNSDFYQPTFAAITFVYSSFVGNTFGQLFGSSFVLNTSIFSSNSVSSPSVDFYGSNNVLDSNTLRDVSFDSSASRYILTNNKFTTGTASLSNVEGFASRNNVDTGADRDILAPGRISVAGELVGQTVIDGANNGFVCQTASTTYKQVNDDVDPTKKAFVQFYVPANRKIVIRLNTALRDFDNSSGLFYIRLTDVDDETSPASFAAFINDEHIALYNATLFPIYTFEWFIDGTDPNINWTAGDLKTFWFQIKVQTASETVSVRAGASYIPMDIGAVAVSDDLSFVDMG